MQELLRTKNLKVLLITSIGALLIAANAISNTLSPFTSASILMAFSCGAYIFIVKNTEDNSWLDVRAVFSFTWMFTIGLASLRLLEYQKQWQSKTWLLLALTYGLFPIGVTIGQACGEKFREKLKAHKTEIFGRIVVAYQPHRLYWLCVIVSLIGLVSFGINIAIRGTVPFLTDSQDAYVQFYTKFHVFSVAATTISGACYYSVKRQQLSKCRKTVLYFLIIYHTFIFPTLVVSRGVFLTSAIPLTTVIFYLNRKRFLILLICLTVIMGFYVFLSSARNYSDAQLNTLFEPAEVSLSPKQEETEPAEVSLSPKQEETKGATEPRMFALSGKAAFMYSYLTVSHDNFNEAVLNSTHYSYGIRQMSPFNVILRIDFPQIEKTYLVREHLNTHNLIGDAYYDFHEIGVFVFAITWSIVFGVIQGFYAAGKGLFALLALGYSVAVVALSFFAPWLSIFTHWLNWGTVLLFFMVCNISIAPRNRNERIVG